MLGLVLTLLLAGIWVVIGASCLRRFVPGLGLAESLGVGGALALATLGTLGMLVGLANIGNGASIATWVILLASFVWPIRSQLMETLSGLKRLPKMVVILLPFVLIASIAVLAPSDMRDWDTLAYHLAVPKLWMEEGRIVPVPGIHHSNFPFTADLLYLWGQQWGGQTGAKAFNLVWMLAGCSAVTGIARRWYGAGAWWGALVFAGCPVVLWEAGTAYIDIPHGLFAGLAVLYLVDALRSGDRKFWILCGWCLGFAMGTKHTGLQTLLSCMVVGGLTLLWIRRRAEPQLPAGSMGAKGLALAGVLALAVAAPWYVKSTVMTGNPVYPFFYRQLGGKDWNQWRADTYTNEQKSFGVGTNPMNLGHAVLGLAYQPGRYVNPGQQQGMGFPTGAIGFAAFLAGLTWCASGRSTSREKTVLACVGMSLLMWFVLSQQSRYLTSLVVPLAVLAAGAVGQLRSASLVKAGVAVQAAVALAVVYLFQTREQIPVALGQVTREDYQAARIPFFVPSKTINALSGNVKVALYDEVFGYFLDKPYMWANPGHSTLIPYETCDSATQWVASMKELGFTHAYASFQFLDPTAKERWFQAFGSRPYDVSEKSAVRDNPDLWWRVLFADAVREGLLMPVQEFPEGSQNPRSALFEFAR